MTLMKLIDELQDIADHSYSAEIEVYLMNRDDSVYDGKNIEGIRLVKEMDCEENEKTIKLFLTYP